MRKLTMKDVAKAANVSQSTVSLALRNDPRLSKETSERVRSIAEKLGYRPDPALSALVAYRASTRPKGDYGKIAVLHDCEREWPNFPVGSRQMVEGITEQAEKCGYNTELFRVTEDREECRKLSRMLYFRGVRGMIVTPVRMPALHLDWEQFSTVAMGEYFSTPQLNRVTPDHEWLLRTTYQELKNLGYRKIGYCNARVSEERKHQIYLGAYLKSLYMDGIDLKDSPPYYYEEGEEWSPVGWLKRYGFDAVMVMVPHHFLQRLQGTEYTVPERLGVAGFTLPKYGEEHYAGHRIDYHQMGVAAVDQLQSMLHLGKRGVPGENEHFNTLIRGQWRMGETARTVQK